MTLEQVAERIRAILDCDPQERRALFEAFALELEIKHRQSLERATRQP